MGSRTFLYEGKKMLQVRKGAWVILLFFVFGFLLLAVTDTPEFITAEYERDHYFHYLDQLEGKCTSQKIQWIEEEARTLSRAEDSLQLLYDSYYSGKVSQEEFQRQAQELHTALQHQPGFQVLYDQYLTIHEDMERRYFLPVNGWHGLLASGPLDFLLAAVLLLLVTPVFCDEYGCRMDSLIRTARQGRRNMVEKLLLVFLAATFLCLGCFAMRVGFYAAKYGLPHGDYPLQSVPYFNSGTKPLSLWGAFLLLCGLKWSGCLFFSGLILLASALTKKYALTGFLSAAAVALPYFGLSSSWQYRFPSPLPFLLGTGFLKGSEFQTDFLSGEKLPVFEEISPGFLAGFWGASALLCAGAVLFLLHRHRNCWDRPIPAFSRMGALRGVAFLLCFFLAAGFSGCGGGAEGSSSAYNLSSGPSYEWQGNIITMDFDTGYLLAGDPASGQTEALPHPPLDLLTQPLIWPILYGNYGKVYTLRQDENRYIDRVGQFSGTVQMMSIVETDLKTFQEKIIFQQNVSPGRMFLGVEVLMGDTWQFLTQCRGFFLNQDYLFFVGDRIHQLDRKTGNLTVLEIPLSKNVAFDGQSIYYIGKDSVLSRYDPGTGVHSSLPEIAAYDFNLSEQGIYYLNRRDDDKIYFCGIDGTNSRKLVDLPANSLTREQGSLYFHHKLNQNLYRADEDGGRARAVDTSQTE